MLNFAKSCGKAVAVSLVAIAVYNVLKSKVPLFKWLP